MLGSSILGVPLSVTYFLRVPFGVSTSHLVLRGFPDAKSLSEEQSLQPESRCLVGRDGLPLSGSPPTDAVQNQKGKAQDRQRRPSRSEHPGVDLSTGKSKGCLSGYHFHGLKMAKLAGAVHIDSVPPGAWPFLSITSMWHNDPLRWGAHVPILQGPEEKHQEQRQEPRSTCALDRRAHSLGKRTAGYRGSSEQTNTGRPQRTEREGWEGGPPDLSRLSRFYCRSKLTRLLTEVTAQAQPQDWACGGWECVSEQRWSSGRCQKGMKLP